MATSQEIEPQSNLGVATLAVLGGTLLGVVLLLQFFKVLQANGYPTAVIAGILIFVGIFSLASQPTSYLPSLFIILIGLFVFAAQLGILGSGVAPWLWPLFIFLVSILALVYIADRRSKS